MTSIPGALPTDASPQTRKTGGVSGSLPIIIAGLILSAVLPYANTLLNGFVHDDNRQVVANPYLRNFRHLPDIFGTTVWSFIGAQGITNYYRPMMTLGYLFCYQFFGQLAYGFHLANVLLHTAIVLILFALTTKLFRDRALAVIAAGVFALHPIHTESVAWIAAVTDLELTLFYLLTFWFYLAMRRLGGGRSDRVQLALAGSFILAVLSKEQALTLPFLATAYEHFYREDRAETTLEQKLSRYGILWLLALAYVLFRIRFLGALAPSLQMANLTWYEVILSSVALVGQYLGKLFWPVRLCAFYVFGKSVSPLDPRVISGLAALILSLVLFRLLWKRARSASFAILWIFATLAPVLNARWMAANVFAERYLYLPSVGFSWLVAWAVVELIAPWIRRRGLIGRRAGVTASCLIAVLAFFRIVTRNRDWQSDLVLFTHTLAVSPGAFQIRNNLGVVYWERGDVNSAEREWREALGAAPKNAIVLNNLGLLALKRKRPTDAVELFRRAMRSKPNYTDPHLNLGSAYAEMGLRDEAALQFRAAVTLSPLNARAHNEWGKLLLRQGRTRDAEEQYRMSVDALPNGEGYDALGDIYVRSGRHQLAERAFQGALSLERFDTHAHFGLGALYAEAGRNAEAIREYQAGLITDPTNKQAVAAIERLQAQRPNVKR